MTSSADCPCPSERKVLLQAMEAIVAALIQDKTDAPSGPCESCRPPIRCPANENLPTMKGSALEAEQCKSSELRGGVFLTECTCLKRDGLQHACQRTGCRDCGPGRSVDCCPGKHQAQRLKYFEEQAQLRKRQPPSPPPEELDPAPPSPAPRYSDAGLFRHQCRPSSRCPPRRPAHKMPCGGASCKHWEVPKPCTLPVCRADCFESC